MAALFTCRRHYFLFALALASLSAALYAPIFRSPPVLDDYNWLQVLCGDRAWPALLSSFNPLRGLFFRPLSSLYHFVLFHLFGSDPIGYRVAFILWTTLHGMFFASFLWRWLADRRLAVAGAVLLLAASPCWQDPARWGVSVSDLGCLAGFLASLMFFAGQRPIAAAACQALALCFKENAIVLPALLLLLWWTNGGRDGWRGACRRLAPCVGVSAVYLALKIVALIHQSGGAGTPYVVKADQPRQIANLAAYAKWSFDGLVPALAGSGLKERCFGWLWVSPVATALAAAAWVALFAWLAWRRRAAGVAGLWPVLALLPVLVIPGQAYRYYLLYALPGLVALVLLALRRLRPLRPGPAIAAWVLAAVAGGGYYFHHLDAAGWDLGYIDGTNQLARRADVVRRVRAALEERGAWTPGDVLVVEGVEGWAFMRSRGLRVWTGDAGALACERGDLRWRKGRLCIRGSVYLMSTVTPGLGPAPEEYPVDPRRIVYLRREESRLVDHTTAFRAAQR